MIYGDHRLFIQFNTILELNNTSLITLNPQRKKRLELIKSLSDSGMSNVEISDYLNSRSLKTPKGKDYYPKIIWVTLKKYNNRLERSRSYKVIRVLERLVVQKLTILQVEF
jgi:DNA-binding transcriptional MerR regulator